MLPTVSFFLAKIGRQTRVRPRYAWRHDASGQPHALRYWIFPAAALLACLYVPTLATPFDFVDDGSIVHPFRPDSAYQMYRVYLGRVWANFGHLGPFRPALWLHWGAAAELFGGNAVCWRAARFAWLVLSAGMFLWLLSEMGIRRSAAILAGALALWNPYRNEIWTSLTLSEGVAMPYALAALVCAIRATRSRRPAAWDIAGAVCMVLALWCKNTFAAVVPVQLWLRMVSDGRDFREGLRRHGLRAALLALTLLLPLAHYVVFRWQWHAGQYEPGTPSWAQAGRILSALKGALSLEWLGLGCLLSLVALGGWRAFGRVWRENRGVCQAGMLLLAAGVAVYLPMQAMSGRYTLPAVWGADLLVAALLSSLVGAAACPSRRAAFAALGCGLVVVALANLGRQDKFQARAVLLWDALHEIEHDAPAGSAVTWVCGRDLNFEEGIHFQWHLRALGRADVAVSLRDAEGCPLRRVELPEMNRPARFAVAGNDRPPAGGDWRLVREVCAAYWAGHRHYHCYVWRKEDSSETPRKGDSHE